MPSSTVATVATVATELDRGDRARRGDELQLADGYRAIVDKLPAISVVGGCCGTDLAHLRAIAAAMVPSTT